VEKDFFSKLLEFRFPVREVSFSSGSAGITGFQKTLSSLPNKPATTQRGSFLWQPILPLKYFLKTTVGKMGSAGYGPLFNFLNLDAGFHALDSDKYNFPTSKGFAIPVNISVSI
jgi:hypothetical protein